MSGGADSALLAVVVAVAVLLAALAVGAVPRRARARIGRVTAVRPAGNSVGKPGSRAASSPGGRGARGRAAGLASAASGPAALRGPRLDRRAHTAALLAAAGALAVLPLPVGLGLAAVSVAVLPRWLASLETSAARRRRSRCLRDLPVAADLFAACVLGGAAPAHAAAVVADAVGGPIGESLAAASRSLSLGADPVVAWLTFGDDAVLAPWGRALARSARSGAPVAGVVTRIADDARAVRRTAAAAAARRATVTATLPLGLCFLPAFLLAGVAPLIVGFVLPVLGLLA